MVIANNLTKFENREHPEKLVKYKYCHNTANHLTNTKKEIDYKYYVCDYCKEEIKIEKDRDKRKGGTLVIPQSLTKRNKIELALHNRCINAVLREFEPDRVKIER